MLCLKLLKSIQTSIRVRSRYYKHLNTTFVRRAISSSKCTGKYFVDLLGSSQCCQYWDLCDTVPGRAEV